MSGKWLEDQRISERAVLRWKAGVATSVKDPLSVEEPLELRADGKSLAIIMRTPGHDLELLRGLLHAEGVIRAGEADAELRVASPRQLGELERGNVVELHMPADRLHERWAERDLISSSACGVCGASALAVLEDIAVSVRSDLRWSHAMVTEVPAALREHQEVFEQTGGLHGAALFDEHGQVLVCREDVGRHNAVDKLVGWATAQDRLPLSTCVLGVSGRLSYEIVHKAVAAGIPIVVAVSAPSSLAVDLAERWRVTLAGFVRGDGFNVYSHPARIIT